MYMLDLFHIIYSYWNRGVNLRKSDRENLLSRTITSSQSCQLYNREGVLTVVVAVLSYLDICVHNSSHWHYPGLAIMLVNFDSTLIMGNFCVAKLELVNYFRVQ